MGHEIITGMEGTRNTASMAAAHIFQTKYKQLNTLMTLCLGKPVTFRQFRKIFYRITHYPFFTSLNLAKTFMRSFHRFPLLDLIWLSS